MISLPDALKQMRRKIYLYQSEWRTVVIGRDAQMCNLALTEINALMEASSILVERVVYTRRTLVLERGARIQIKPVRDLTDAYCHLAGFLFTHMIWLYEPEAAVAEYAKSCLRSPTVSPEEFLNNRVDW